MAKHAFARELLVHLLDTAFDELGDSRVTGKVDIAGIGDITPLSPVANSLKINIDKGPNPVAVGAENNRFFYKAEKLQLVLDVFWRKDFAIGHLGDILGPVDDAQITIAVDDSRIAGVEVAFGINGFGGRFWVFVVFLEQRYATDQDLAAFTDLDFNAGGGLADRVIFHFAVALNAGIGTALGLTVELL